MCVAVSACVHIVCVCVSVACVCVCVSVSQLKGIFIDRHRGPFASSLTRVLQLLCVCVFVFCVAFRLLLPSPYASSSAAVRVARENPIIKTRHTQPLLMPLLLFHFFFCRSIFSHSLYTHHSPCCPASPLSLSSTLCLSYPLSFFLFLPFSGFRFIALACFNFVYYFILLSLLVRGKQFSNRFPCRWK